MRARRVKHPYRGHEVELYVDYDDGGPPETVGLFPLAQVPNLVLDLSIALKGEAISRSAPPPSRDTVSGEVVDRSA